MKYRISFLNSSTKIKQLLDSQNMYSFFDLFMQALYQRLYINFVLEIIVILQSGKNQMGAIFVSSRKINDAFTGISEDFMEIEHQMDFNASNSQRLRSMRKARQCKKFAIFLLVLLISLIVLFWYVWILFERFQIEKYYTKLLKYHKKCGPLIKDQRDFEVVVPLPLEQDAIKLISFSNIEEIQQYEEKDFSKLEFSTRLYMNWIDQNPFIDRMQYHRLNISYNLQRNVLEKNICVVSPFRNLLSNGFQNASFHLYLKSLNGQNYSNYHVYMIDDASTDNSKDAVFRELIKYPRLNNRFTLIKNKISFGALSNRDYVTRNFCQSGDIVLQIDGDDALVGKQVFNLFNRFYYNNPQSWFVYANFIQLAGQSNGNGRNVSLDQISMAERGPSNRIPIWSRVSNSYRTDMLTWTTSEIRSYLQEFYLKIPLDYFQDPNTCSYYQKASDRFVAYALAELAGPDHTFYYDEYLYFYYQPNLKALKNYMCSLQKMYYYEALSRSEIPFKQLQSLKENPERREDYQIPSKIIKFRFEAEVKYLECLQELNQQ